MSAPLRPRAGHVFYDPSARTFRPFCRRALATMAAGPAVLFAIAIVLSIFP
jgi:hypothetical protein